MTIIGPWQFRAVIFFVSSVIIAAEIILMRDLALRFWEHLAWLVISIALLGFGVSGTILVLVQRFFDPARQSLQYLALLGMALSFPLCLHLGDKIDFNLIQLAWQPSQFWKLGALEAVLILPFILGGIFIALALQDKPENVPGHYSASFIGSATGGIIILPALFFLPPRMLMLCCSIIILISALPYCREKSRAAGWACSALLLAIMAWQAPHTSKISEDKDLPQILAMPGSAIVAQRYGPQGLVQIVKAPAVHAAPGLSLMNVAPVPEQLLVTRDAQILGSLYKNSSDNDFAFLNNTTQALAYQFGALSSVLIGNAAGNDQLGLALYHGAQAVTVLTENRSLEKLKRTDNASYGRLYQRPNISLQTDTLRGYLTQSDRKYSLIVLPLTGTDFGGLMAAAADSLLTLDTFRLCFERLYDSGMLSITTHAHSPPRESLRLLNMFIDALHENGREPHNHIAIIRNWATVTLVASKSEINVEQTEMVRAFTNLRGFDLVWLPDLKSTEINRFHQLDEPHYYLGTQRLFSAQKKKFTSAYVYDLTSPNNNRPFFHHFNRRSIPTSLAAQLGRRSRAYTELGTTLLAGALGQAFILALTLIIFPLIPTVGLPGKKSEHVILIGFFAAIGFGFMLLEIGLLQRLTVYLSHPVYAASAVLSGFLFFGGLGSGVSSRMKDPLAYLHCGLGAAIVAVGLVTVLVIGSFLAATQGLHVPAKMAIAILLIAPIATLMGMMFPLGIKRVGRNFPHLVPWAWGINGFSSVLATLCTPLIAMGWGFNIVALSALGCYMLAALLSLKLPR